MSFIFESLTDNLRKVFNDAHENVNNTCQLASPWRAYSGPAWALPYSDAIDVEEGQAVFVINNDTNLWQCLVIKEPLETKVTDFVVYYAEIPSLHLSKVIPGKHHDRDFFERLLANEMIK